MISNPYDDALRNRVATSWGTSGADPRSDRCDQLPVPEVELTSPGPMSPGPRQAVVRVCLVGPSLSILGGQAVQLDRLLGRLKRLSGVEVDFIAVNPVLPAVLRPLQRVRYVRTVANSVAYMVALALRIRRCDVVHAFSPSYWAFLLGPVPAMAAARLFGCGALLNYHSGEAEDHLSTWPSAMRLMRLAHRIAVPSGYLERVFAKFGIETRVIPNFIDPDAFPFRVRTNPRPLFLSNRNLEPLYNVACVVRAFARIQARLPNAELVIAGYGSQRRELEQLVTQLRLANVRFAGRVPPGDMARLLDGADVMLNSPDIDNMPLSLIEAQAAGLPLVSTSTGGIPWVVRDDVSGLLVPPGDDEALARAAIRMVEEPGLAERLSRQGRDDCLANYTWEAVEQQWIELYREVAAMSRRTRKGLP